MHDRPLSPVLGRHGQRPDAQPAHFGLCCISFRASITQRTRTSLPGKATEHEMAGRGGAERGTLPQVRAGRACFCAGVRPACASLCAGARLGRAFLCAGAQLSARSQRRAGTQRAIGKERSAAEICGMASGHERPGADFRRGIRARRNRELGPSLRSLSFLSHFTSFPCSKDLAGCIGYTGRRRGSR